MSTSTMEVVVVAVGSALAAHAFTHQHCAEHGRQFFNKHGRCPKCPNSLRPAQPARMVRESPVKIELASVGLPREKYTCPEHGEVSLNKTGHCPKCFMAHMQQGWAQHWESRNAEQESTSVEVDASGAGVEIEVKLVPPTLPVVAVPTKEESTITLEQINESIAEGRKGRRGRQR
jgi:hypothetical protein